MPRVERVVRVILKDSVRQDIRPEILVTAINYIKFQLHCKRKAFVIKLLHKEMSCWLYLNICADYASYNLWIGNVNL